MKEIGFLDKSTHVMKCGFSQFYVYKYLLKFEQSRNDINKMLNFMVLMSSQNFYILISSMKTMIDFIDKHLIMIMVLVPSELSL